MPKRGDVRADGRIFRGMNGDRESWLSPEAWERMQSRAAALHQAAKARRKKDPVAGSAYNDYMADYMRRRRREDPRPFMLRAAKNRAAKAGIPFAITLADLGDVPDRCPVLGIALSVSSGKVGAGSPTIDRKSCQLGYVPGNVVIISHLANRIKSDATPEQLRRVADFFNSPQQTRSTRRKLY